MARHKVSKDEYLRILNETLTHHPAYSDRHGVSEYLTRWVAQL